MCMPTYVNIKSDFSTVAYKKIFCGTLFWLYVKSKFSQKSNTHR